MNRLIPLLLTFLLLTGCAAQNLQVQPPEQSPPVRTSDYPEQVLPYRSSTTQSHPAGASDSFSLPDRDVSGFLSMGNELLLFSDNGGNTELTLLSGSTLSPTHSRQLGFLLTVRNSTLRFCGDGISFFDSQTMETVVLDSALQDLRRIPAPERLMGMPVLSCDGSMLYYCTDSAIRALDLQSGISRIIKESDYPIQSVSGLLLEDTVLQVTITDRDNAFRTLFLSAETGQLLSEKNGPLAIETNGTNYCTRFYSGAAELLLFGNSQDSPKVLLPREYDDCLFLNDCRRAVAVSQKEGNTQLDCYDLEAGMRTASLLLEEVVHPKQIAATEDGMLWILGHSDSQDCNTLYRWQPELSAVADDRQYAGDYYTRDNPDYEGLAACRLYARDIGSRHGVEVLIYREAAEQQPWDYVLEYEYSVPLIRQELEQLDARLSHYPPGFLQTLSGRFTGIRICIVRQIRGSPESGSVEMANGIQFFQDRDACIVLAAGQNTDRALYHELCHLTDTVVMTESTAYDQWETLNPSGFRYSCSAVPPRDSSQWLQEDGKAFLDAYSMTYPKEDRARIMEFAMTPNHAHYFRSPILQAKLIQLCIGIREAFGLEDSPETFLWEQYLQTPLAPAE